MDIRFFLKAASNPAAASSDVSGPMTPRGDSSITKSGGHFGPVMVPSCYLPDARAR